MPIYEYICTACKEKFEVQRKFSDPPITTCTEFSCPKGEPVEKLISSPAIMFKGSGWYVTDYSDKLKEPKRPGEDGKPKEKTSGTKAEGKSESGSSSAPASDSSSGSSSTSSGSTPSSGSSGSASSGSSSESSSSASSSSSSGGKKE